MPAPALPHHLLQMEEEKKITEQSRWVHARKLNQENSESPLFFFYLFISISLFFSVNEMDGESYLIIVFLIDNYTRFD